MPQPPSQPPPGNAGQSKKGALERVVGAQIEESVVVLHHAGRRRLIDADKHMPVVAVPLVRAALLGTVDGHREDVATHLAVEDELRKPRRAEHAAHGDVAIESGRAHVVIAIVLAGTDLLGGEQVVIVDEILRGGDLAVENGVLVEEHQRRIVARGLPHDVDVVVQRNGRGGEVLRPHFAADDVEFALLRAARGDRHLARAQRMVAGRPHETRVDRHAARERIVAGKLQRALSRLPDRRPIAAQGTGKNHLLAVGHVDRHRARKRNFIRNGIIRAKLLRSRPRQCFRPAGNRNT